MQSTQRASTTPSTTAQPITTRLSRHPANSTIATVPHEVQNEVRSPGQPLDSATQHAMGSRFGHDFSQVQIHTGDRSGLLQRKCDVCGQPATESGQCSACGKQVNSSSSTAPESVSQTLARAGSPLPPALQHDMGQRFGHDFSGVRVHTGESAERSAHDVNALAYTVGNHVVFGAGQYTPTSPHTQTLLAHELAHVLQQGGTTVRPNELTLGEPDSPLEHHADQLAAQAMRGTSPRSQPAPTAPHGLVQRHAADKTICPPPPLYKVIGATPKEVNGPANQAIEQAYLNAPRHKGHSVLLGGQFEYGGNKEIRLPKGAPNRKANDAILGSLRGLVRQRAPDIMNFTERTFYEIKTPRYAVSGIVQLGSYYALTDVIRQELGEEGGPPWDQGAATWYPPHVLPFPGNPRRLVCTQMTDYSVTTSGLILYVVLEKQEKEEEKEKKKQVQEVAKPETKKEPQAQQAPQQKQLEEKQPKDDSSIIPEVAIGVGGAALTAATIAYLRKKAADEAKRRAAQLAWRKMAEAAAARRAAQAAGKGALGKVAGKAVAYAEIAAAAALIIFYSDRAEAKVGPGESPIETLYKAMTADGTPPSPEMKELLESDPILKQMAEEAVGSGDGSKLQEEMTRRTLELIRDNPDVFSPEDLEFLMEYSKTAKTTGQSPQTVEELRKAIDAAKAGKTGTDKETSKSGEAGKAPGGTDKPADEPAKEPPSPEEVKLVGEIKNDEKLKKIYDAVFGPKGVKVDKAMLERFLALKAKLDAHPELVDVIIKNSVKGNVTNPIKQLIEPIEQLLADAEKPKTEPKQDTPPADQPGTTPAAPQKDEKAEASTAAISTGPSEAEKASATGVEFWTFFDAKAFKAGTIKVDPDETELPTTTAVPITWTRQTPKGKRTYKFSMHGTLKTKLEKFDTKKFRAAGTYDFSTPSKLIKSDQGDEPIYFTDVGVTRPLAWGFLKGSAPAKKSAKK